MHYLRPSTGTTRERQGSMVSSESVSIGPRTRFKRSLKQREPYSAGRGKSLSRVGDTRTRTTRSLSEASRKSRTTARRAFALHPPRCARPNRHSRDSETQSSDVGNSNSRRPRPRKCDRRRRATSRVCRTRPNPTLCRSFSHARPDVASHLVSRFPDHARRYSGQRPNWIMRGASRASRWFDASTCACLAGPHPRPLFRPDSGSACADSDAGSRRICATELTTTSSIRPESSTPSRRSAFSSPFATTFPNQQTFEGDHGHPPALF